jgi:hypothetical protein
MQLFRLLRGLTGSAATCVFASSATAAFVEYSTPITAQAVSFSTTFAVQKFDSNMGTLTGITLTLTSNILGQLDIFNATSAAQNFTNASTTIPVTVTAVTPDTTTVFANATALVGSGVANAGLTSFVGLTATAIGSNFVAVSNWPFYIGLGASTASFTATTPGGLYTGNAAPGVFFGGSGTADGLFKIRYDYLSPSTVPLPNSGAMLLMALVATGFYLRQKRGTHLSFA